MGGALEKLTWHAIRMWPFVVIKVVRHHLYVSRVDDVLRPLLRPILVIF